MSTTAYRSSHSSTTSFSRRQNRTPTSSSPMTNDRARFNARTNNNFAVPVPPPRESLLNSSTAVSSNPPANSSSCASLPTPTSDTPPFVRFRSVTGTDSSEDSTSTASKKLYMFSNPPRVLQRQPAYGSKYLRDGRMRQRVSSAPDENCLQTPPGSPLTKQQPKPSSANETLTPRSRDDSLGAHSRQVSLDPPRRPVVRVIKRDDQQQKKSLAALMQEQQRSKVPEVVQKRRILLLLRRVSPASSPPVPSPRQHRLSVTTTATATSSSVLKPSTHSPDFNRNQHGILNRDERQESLVQQCIVIPSTSSGSHLQQPQKKDSSSPAPSAFNEPDFADSLQLAAILANIQQQDEWNPGEGDSDRSLGAQANTNPHRTTSNGATNAPQKTHDPTKYEYVVANSLDTTTFKLSPRTLRPDEQLAARSRQSQHYRQEMRSSTNAQPPPLLASIIADNSHSGSGGGGDKTITLRLNTTGAVKKQSSLEDVDPLESTLESSLDGEQVPLCFDESLKCFYDPTTGLYYELWAT